MNQPVPLAFLLCAPGRPDTVLGYGMLLPDGTAVTADAERPGALARWSSVYAAANTYAADLYWADQLPASTGGTPAPAADSVPGAGHPTNRRPDHDRVWLTGPSGGPAPRY